MKFTTSTGTFWTCFYLVFAFFSTFAEAGILSSLPKCDDNECHCRGSNGACPALPTINAAAIRSYRELEFANPMTIQCEPFSSLECVRTLEKGEACVVELLPPEGATPANPCPTGTRYRLKTVASLDEALAAGDYVTHTGPCGVCSSLQDLAALLTVDQLPMKGNNCFWRSNGLENTEAARECFQDLGFTFNCARIMVSYQKRVNERCESFCSAFALGHGTNVPACLQSAECTPCNELSIERFETVAGRTEINSGYPFWTAPRCSEIASSKVVNQNDICASSAVPATPAPTSRPTSKATSAPTSAATQSANRQQCLEVAAIELSLSQRTNGNLVCDCEGQAVSPKCYPKGKPNQVCSVQFGTCSTVSDCCSAGVRSCRGGQCRSAARTQLKSQLRIGASRGGREGRLEAARGGDGARRRIRGESKTNNQNGMDQGLVDKEERLET